jgi:hypothetical protein
MSSVVALLIGNVVKECTFALSAQVVNGLGHPFFRRTRTLRGRVVSETYLPDGTWVRCETWKRGAAWEWTEQDGSCTRVESPSMTVVRASPLWLTEQRLRGVARAATPVHGEQS